VEWEGGSHATFAHSGLQGLGSPTWLTQSQTWAQYAILGRKEHSEVGAWLRGFGPAARVQKGQGVG
jgi:hypothetical protein